MSEKSGRENFFVSLLLFETKIEKLFSSNNEDKEKLQEFKKNVTDFKRDVDTLIFDMKKTSENQMKELRKSKENEDQKLSYFTGRYKRLFKNWKELFSTYDEVLKEKEKLQSERDILIMKNRDDFNRQILLSGKSFKDNKLLLKRFFQAIVDELLKTIAANVNCERGTIFLYEKKTDELVSVSIYPKVEGLKIRVPSKKGISGFVFSNCKALNIINAYKDKRFYRKQDEKGGFKTNTILCFPLVKIQEKTSIGCLQLLNKRGGNFQIKDEMKMNSYVLLMSKIIDSVHSYIGFKIEGGKKFINFEMDKLEGSGPERSKSESTGIHIERIGVKRERKENEMKILTEYGNLIPTHLEEFIKRLHESWKASVNTISSYQVKIKKLKGERKLRDVQMLILKKNNERLQEKLDKFHRRKMKGSSSKVPSRRISSKELKVKVKIKKTELSEKKVVPKKRISMVEKMQRGVYFEFFDQLPVPAAIVSEDFRFLHANKEVLQYLKISELQLIGEKFNYLTRGIGDIELHKIFQQKKMMVDIYAGNKSNESVSMTLSIRKIDNVHGRFKLNKVNILQSPPFYVIIFKKNI